MTTKRRLQQFVAVDLPGRVLHVCTYYLRRRLQRNDVKKKFYRTM